MVQKMHSILNESVKQLVNPEKGLNNNKTMLLLLDFEVHHLSLRYYYSFFLSAKLGTFRPKAVEPYK